MATLIAIMIKKNFPIICLHRPITRNCGNGSPEEESAASFRGPAFEASPPFVEA
jgi:hypothetical protein